MASLKTQIESLSEELAQLDVKLEDVSEKIESELSKPKDLRNQSLLNRYLSKEERLLAEKDELMKARGKLLLSVAGDGREERRGAEERRNSEDERATKKKEEESEEEEEEADEEEEEAEEEEEEHEEEAEEEEEEAEEQEEEEEEDEQQQEEEEEEEPYVEPEEGVHGASLAVRDTCHSHTLLHQVLYGKYTCDVCKGGMGFPETMFICKPCDFGAHSSCLTANLRLPPTLTDARHPHPLTLLPKTRTGDLRGHYECSECREVGRTWVYECGTEMCGYKMHPDCVRVQIQAHVGFGHWMTLSYADPKAACNVPSCPHPSRGGDPAVFKCCLSEWKSSSCDTNVHPACIENKTSPYDETKAREVNAALKDGREQMRASMQAEEEAKVQLQLQALQHRQKMLDSVALHNQNMFNLRHFSRHSYI